MSFNEFHFSSSTSGTPLLQYGSIVPEKYMDYSLFNSNKLRNEKTIRYFIQLETNILNL